MAEPAVLRGPPDDRPSSWPVFPGDYVLGSPRSPVAVAIIGRGRVELPPERYAIMGTLKTENMGLEKVIGNVVANPRLRFLILCGQEEFGHFPAQAALGLWREGVDERRRVVGVRSAIPYLCNVGREAIERFRAQVKVIDLVRPKHVEEIVAYDPFYDFDEERREELLRAISACEADDPGPMPGGPMNVEAPALMVDSRQSMRSMNALAMEFTDQMLRMPSERLSVNASLIAVSKDPGVVLDPTDGLVFEVPSVEFAGRLKEYYRGC